MIDSPHRPRPREPERFGDAEPLFILVADDDDGVRSVISRSLVRSGHHVVMAANGAEALAMLATSLRFGLVMLDIHMPGISGLDALPFIRRAAPGVPVMLVSGHVEDDSAMGVLQLGADAILKKPFELSRMNETVERMIELQRLSGATRQVA